MHTEETYRIAAQEANVIISKCIGCLAPFFSGAYDLVKEDLADFFRADDVSVKTTAFYVNHSNSIAAFLQVRDMLRLETTGWKKDLLADYIHRRISEKLVSMVPILVPGLDTDFLSVLSSEHYEGASAKDLSIVLLPSEAAFASLDNTIAFHANNQYAFTFENAHAIRKQMNTGGGTVLATTYFKNSDSGVKSFKTVGLVPIHTLCFYYSVVVKAHAHWMLCFPNNDTLREIDIPVQCINYREGEVVSLLASQVRPCHEKVIIEKLSSLVQYKNGLVQFPRLDLKAELRKIVHQTFMGYTMCDDDAVVEAIINTTDVAKRGTALIVSDPETIAAETEHLVCDHKRGVCISSNVLPMFSRGNAETIRSFSSIDGAIMLDTEGRCHSFGVILDGAINRGTKDENNIGDPSRGAKYNCTKTYVYSHVRPMLGVVISADGMFNVLSNRATE